GATSAVFSVIYAILIDPFPYPRADRIMEMRLVDKAGKDSYMGPSGPQADLIRQAKSIEDVTLMDWWNLTTTDGDLPEDVQANYIDPNAPNHWGIRALKGRWLIPSDAPPGQEPQRVVVVSYQFWQRYYMGDPKVIGRTLQLVHKPYQVVGVMPPRFRWANVDMYLPLKVTRDPNIHYAASIKIRPGVSPEAAAAELEPMIRQLLTESLGIATAGALLGVLLAWRGLSLLVARLPENSFPAESVIKMNWPVLLFSIGLVFFTSIAFGLWPALQLSRPQLARLVQSSSRRVAGSVGARRSHGALVAAQVALTLLMLTAAAAAGKGFLRLVNTDLGYDPHNAMSVPIPVHENTHVAWKDRAEFFEQIRARIAAMPEVVAAGISTNATPPSNGWRQNIEILGSTATEKP